MEGEVLLAPTGRHPSSFFWHYPGVACGGTLGRRELAGFSGPACFLARCPSEISARTRGSLWETANCLFGPGGPGSTSVMFLLGSKDEVLPSAVAAEM